MGATFPIASRWIVRTASTAARDAGGLYAANTLGAAAGAILAGFWLIPLLGLRGTTLVGVGLNVIAAAGAWMIATPAHRRRNGPDPGAGSRAPKSAVTCAD